MGCNKRNNIGCTETTNIVSNRPRETDTNVAGTYYDTNSGNCTNTYVSGNCAHIIRPIGLPCRKPCKQEVPRPCENEGVGGCQTEYAYLSARNVILSAGYAVQFTNSIEGSDSITSDENGNISLEKGVYQITYSLMGQTSEAGKAFTVRPFVNDVPMSNEGVSVYGISVGITLSASSAFILKALDGTTLSFRVKNGSQTLSGASFNVSIVKLR